MWHRVGQCKHGASNNEIECGSEQRQEESGQLWWIKETNMNDSLSETVTRRRKYSATRRSAFVIAGRHTCHGRGTRHTGSGLRQ